MQKIKIACKAAQALPIDKLNFLQGDFKELSEEAYQKLSSEILETGFAFAPHVWKNPKDKKFYLLDGHQRIKVCQRLAEEKKASISEVPVVLVEAKTIKEAKRRVLQATSQYGKITDQGLANFALAAGVSFDELNLNFDLPNVDLKRFFETFTSDGKIVTVSSHERQVGVVNGADENAEWVGMPGFEPGGKEFKLILIFGSEKDREKFCDAKKIEVTNVNVGQWTSRL